MISAQMEQDWHDSTAARDEEMRNLSPSERDRRIAAAGDQVIDLREIFEREQAS